MNNGFFRRHLRTKRGMAMLAGLAVASMLSPQVMAQVVWEDYRGNSGLTSGLPYVGEVGKPTFANDNNSTSISNLKQVSADPGNAVRTGTSSNINFLQSEYHLCDYRSQGNPTGPACQYQAMGRVAYALIVFPAAGTYTLGVAHDDSVEVNLSSDYANTSYRNASYDIPVGALGGWTNSDQDYASVGSFSAANPNSCALIRVYWTNQAGLNFNRLRWTPPGGTAEIIPAAQFRNPGLSDSANGCNGSIAGNGTAISLNKVLGSPRLSTSDQFTIEIGTSQASGTVRSATTSGATTGQLASTGAFPAATGTTYFLREVMASGSASALTAYAATIACTRNGASFNPLQIGNAADRRWSVVPAANDQIVCAITNTAPMADLSIVKTANPTDAPVGANVEFNLLVSNVGPDNITNAVVQDPVVPGLSCTTAPTCTVVGGTATCPSTPTIGDLQGAGLLIPAMSADSSVRVSLSCTVSAP